MAISFAIILYKQLHNAIGRKSSKVDEQSSFGIKAINNKFMLPKTLQVVLISYMTLNK